MNYLHSRIEKKTFTNRVDTPEEDQLDFVVCRLYFEVGHGGNRFCILGTDVAHTKKIFGGNPVA